MFKKIMIVLIVLVILFIGAIIAIPFLFKDEIAAAVKDEINNNLNAKADIKAFDLSLLSTFPDLTLSITGLEVIGLAPFEGDTLAAIQDLDISLDLMTVLSGEQVDVKKVQMNRPIMRALVLKDGTANWNITKDDGTEEPEAGSSGFNFKLNYFGITDGDVLYDDAESGIRTHAKGLDFDLNGDFTEDLMTMHTIIHADQMDYFQDGMQYMKKIKLDFNADLEVDNVAEKYTFKENEIKLNEFALGFDGFLQFIDDGIEMDLKFDAKQTEFKNLLSIAPGAYTADFANVKAKGKIDFNGYFKLFAKDPDKMAYGVNLNVFNGHVQYPDLPSAVENIMIKAKVENPDGDPDHAHINVPECHLEFNKVPVDLKLILKTPISDPDIDANIKGTVDLATIKSAIPLEGVTQFAGTIQSDVTAKGRLSAIEQGRYEDFQANGTINGTGIKYASTDLPQAVNVKQVTMTFNPKDIILNDMAFSLGKSNMNISATLNNYLGYFIKEDQELKGSVNLSSSYFDAAEFLDSPDSGTATATEEEETSDIPLPDNMDLIVNANFQKLVYRKTVVENIVSQNRVKDGFLSGNMSLTSTYMDVDELMALSEDEPLPEGQAPPEEEPFLVPENLDYTVTGTVKKVLYDNIEMTNVTGKIIAQNGSIKFQGVNADLLGGKMGLNGSYTTKDTKMPLFDLAYDVKDFDVQKSMAAFGTIEKIAPVAKYVKGKYSSTMNMKGNLDNEMFPDVSTLTGEGLALMLNGNLTNFEPLNKIGSTLKMDELKDIALNGIKTIFEIKDGKIVTRPFTVVKQGITMDISGAHGFDQTLNYVIKMDVPKSKFGSQAKGVLDNLLGEASKQGVNIQSGDRVKFNVLVGGTFTNPTIKTSLKDQVADIKDNLEDLAKQELDKKKKELEDKAKAEKEKLEKEARAKAQAEADKIMKDAQTQANRIKQETKVAADKMKAAGYANADKVEKSAKNPLEKQAKKIAADKIRSETDKKHRDMIAEGDRKANDVMKAARAKADALLK